MAIDFGQLIFSTCIPRETITFQEKTLKVCKLIGKELIELDGKKILIVDDEPGIVEILRDELELENVIVTQAANGKSAIDSLKSESSDAVISDIRMPGGSGVELLKQIKSRKINIPVLMITGFPDFEPDEIYSEGAEGLLLKPFALDAMMVELKRIFQRQFRPQQDAATSVLPLKKCKIICSLENFATAIAKQDISIGRGGLFIRGLFPEAVAGPAAFLIKFESGPIHEFSGEGIIRWTRNESLKRPLGLGIEIVSLSREAQVLFDQQVKKAQPVAFIPLA